MDFAGRVRSDNVVFAALRGVTPDQRVGDDGPSVAIYLGIGVVVAICYFLS